MIGSCYQCSTSWVYILVHWFSLGLQRATLSLRRRGTTTLQRTFETLTKLSSLALSPRLFWAEVSSKIENSYWYSHLFICSFTHRLFTEALPCTRHCAMGYICPPGATSAPSALCHQLCTISSAPSTLHRQLCTISSVLSPLHHQLCTVSSASSALYHQLCTLCSVPSTLYPLLCTINSASSTLYHQLCTINSAASALHHQLCTMAQEEYSFPLTTPTPDRAL